MPATVIETIPRKVFWVKGDLHSGWSMQASKPFWSLARRMEFRFEIVFDGYGYLLCHESLDHDLGGDTWHESQAAAEMAALEAFGVRPDEWRRPPVTDSEVV